jgi:hypothetical protein
VIVVHESQGSVAGLREGCGSASRREVGLDGVRDRLAAFRDLGADTAIVVLDRERGAGWVRRLADAALR